MDREKFEDVVQVAIESEPLKSFELKLLGIGADKMVFETPGSDRKIIKVSISDVISQILNLLEIKTARNFEENLLKIINEHKKIEEELTEIFGQEHLLKNGVFKVKVPITKDVLLKVLRDIEDDKKLRIAIEKLDTDTILEVETIAETQTKAIELIDQKKYETDDFNTDLIREDEFRDAGEVLKAFDLAKKYIDRNFLSAYDIDSIDEMRLEVIREILTKIIKFTKKTGLMMDIFGPNNITIFKKEDGTIDYHLLDVILPGQQEHWVKNIKSDPNLNLLRHYYVYYYSIKSLADKLEIQDNITPEDLIYFKDKGIPTEGYFPNIEGNKIEKKEKPETLFIGTQSKGKKEFTPRKGNYRGENEGAVIFSTPDRALASVFMIKDHNDSWTKIGYFGDVLVTVICMDREDYVKNDNGGVIYEVPSENFDYNPNLGMGDKEYTSRDPVKPINEIDYSSSLDTMLNNGVQVYFVDKKTFENIWEAKDYGKEIISNLASENSRIGKNIKKLY